MRFAELGAPQVLVSNLGLWRSRIELPAVWTVPVAALRRIAAPRILSMVDEPTPVL